MKRQLDVMLVAALAASLVLALPSPRDAQAESQKGGLPALAAESWRPTSRPSVPTLESVVTTLQATVATLQTSVTALQTANTNLQNALNAEIAARMAADSALQASGTILSAHVAANGTLIGGRGVTSGVRQSVGSYLVVFNQSLESCQFSASGLAGNIAIPSVPYLRLIPSEFDVNTLLVQMISLPLPLFGPQSAAADSAFTLLVLCPAP